MTLLEQAKAHRHKARRKRLDCSEEVVALAVAYVAGEVTFTQAKYALGASDGNVFQELAPALREGLKRGLVRPPAMRAR